MRLRLLLSALPDALTAALYAVAWLAPAWLGPGWIRGLMLLMAIEFFVVHSGAYFSVKLVSADSAAARARGALGVGAFYALFVGAICIGTKTWWPALAFAWLIAGRLHQLVVLPQPPDAEAARQFLLWVVSVLAWLGSVLLTAALPVPALGFDAAAREAARVFDSGVWAERPQALFAAGLLYFLTLAIAKARGLGVAVDEDPVRRR